jgi:hypothetical protein
MQRGEREGKKEDAEMREAKGEGETKGARQQDADADAVNRKQRKRSPGGGLSMTNDPRKSSRKLASQIHTGKRRNISKQKLSVLFNIIYTTMDQILSPPYHSSTQEE